MVLHLNNTVPKLINSGLLRRQLNCIWNMCSLKSPSLGPKHKLTRGAGCRLCKTPYGHAPLQVSGMGLRICSHLWSDVNWPHQLPPSFPCHFNSSIIIYFVFTEKGRIMIQVVIQKNIKKYGKKLVSTTCSSKMSFMPEHTTHLLSISPQSIFSLQKA